MPQFFVSIFLPEDFDPSTQTEADAEAIHALTREMDAAGVVEKMRTAIRPDESQ